MGTGVFWWWWEVSEKEEEERERERERESFFRVSFGKRNVPGSTGKARRRISRIRKVEILLLRKSTEHSR
jgi:hypothetical protein